MPAIFKVLPSEENKYAFELIGSKGDVLLVSADFESRELAEKAIQDVRVGSLMSQQIAKAQTPSGGHFFMIKDNAGTPLVKSMLYDDEMLFNNALHTVRDIACIAEIRHEQVAG